MGEEGQEESEPHKDWVRIIWGRAISLWQVHRNKSGKEASGEELRAAEDAEQEGQRLTTCETWISAS